MGAFRQDGGEPGKREYSTPARVQAWFLRRSRDNWKSKYMDLKSDQKRLQNRVHDVVKSREEWREECTQQSRRVAELEAEVTALHEQLAAFKKDGQLRAAGPRR